jgi:hypothetical protein
MRRILGGLGATLAIVAVMATSAAPAMAAGGGSYEERLGFGESLAAAVEP